MDDRLPPRVRAGRHDQQDPPRPCARIETASSHQHVERIAPTMSANRSPRAHVSERRTVRQARRCSSMTFTSSPSSDRDVHELAGLLAAAVLDDQQARAHHLEHRAETRDRPDQAPDRQRFPVTPDAQVDAGALDGRARAASERSG